MFRAVVFGLLVFLYGCLEKNVSSYSANAPEGVPVCKETAKYPGFYGRMRMIDSVANVSISPAHVNDAVYKLIGPKAEESMMLVNVHVKNKGRKSLEMDRSSLYVGGENSERLNALPPNVVLTMARGEDVTPRNSLEKLGDKLISTELYAPIDIGPEESGIMKAAFPLPLPDEPKVVVLVENNSIEIPICWGVARKTGYSY